MVITVADGLGSAPFSKEGANAICPLCAEMLNSEITKETIIKLKEDWKKKIKTDFDKYDTTIKYIAFSDSEIKYGGVGDGWICIYGNDEVLSTEIDHTFSNQTDSILSIDLLNKFLNKKMVASDEFVSLIATDGFSEDIDKANLKAFMKDIQNSMVTDIDAFANEIHDTLNNCPLETNCDDKTVVFFLRRGIA